MKYLICIIYIVLFSIAIGGCYSYSTSVSSQIDNGTESSTDQASTSNESSKIKIGITMQGLEWPFIMRVKDGLKSVLANMDEDIDAVILDGQANAEKQNSQVEKFITEDYDVIVLNPISYLECGLAVDQANLVGIPIIVIISSTYNSDQAQARVLPDHKESGRIQVDMVAEYLNNNGKIVILEGLYGIESQVDRSYAYQEQLKKYPQIQVIEQQTANWNKEDAYAITETWLQSGKKFEVVMAQNDNMALGALQAIEEAGLADRIKVFGIDGDYDALMSVKDGGLQGTLFWDANLIAINAVKYAIQLANGQQVESELIKYQRVTKENVDEILNTHF